MGVDAEVETYKVGETDDFTVNLLVRARSDPETSSWTVELTTRGHHAPGSTLAVASFQMPADSAEQLAPLIYRAGQVLAELIDADADNLPDTPPA